MNSRADKYWFICSPEKIPGVIESEGYKKNGEATRKIGDKAKCEVKLYLKEEPTSQAETFFKEKLNLLIYIKVMSVNQDLKDKLTVSELLFGERKPDSFQENIDVARGMNQFIGKLKKVPELLFGERKPDSSQESIDVDSEMNQFIDKLNKRDTDIVEGDVLVLGLNPSDYFSEKKTDADSRVDAFSAYRINSCTGYFCSYSVLNKTKNVILDHLIGDKMLKEGLLGNHDKKSTDKMLKEGLLGNHDKKSTDKMLKEGLLGNHDKKSRSRFFIQLS
jgi:hypothetical protein